MLNKHKYSSSGEYDKKSKYEKQHYSSRCSILFTSVVSIISALITIIFFERIQKQYRHENAEAARKRRLQIFVGSEVNVVAVGALEELKAEGWLEGVLQDEMTLLHGANWQNAYLPCVQLPGKEMIGMNLAQAHLRKANLTQVYLRNANLAQSRLYETNLQGANLIGANFRDAELVSANLQYADLSETNMMGANLYNVNLEGAVLTHANLAAANLSEANLKGAKLISTNLRGVVFSEHHLVDEYIETQFDAETILPDKTKYNPVLGKAQLERFINPDRTDFWQPGWVRVWNYTGRVPRWLGRWYRDES